MSNELEKFINDLNSSQWKLREELFSMDADIKDIRIKVKPIVRGEWIYKGREPRIEQIYKCSVCERYNREKSNYCPNCGADMRGEKKARWMVYREDEVAHYCSNCKQLNSWGEVPFCPWCGADMRGEDDEQIH